MWQFVSGAHFFGGCARRLQSLAANTVHKSGEACPFREFETDHSFSMSNKSKLAKRKSEMDQASKGTAKKPTLATGASAAGTSQDDGKERYTFFYTSSSPFSNWHPAEFTVNGIKYNCTEQYMMHQKAVLFKDTNMAEKILESKDPKTQKALGRKVSNFEDSVWKEKCRDIVKDGNKAKFAQNEDLKHAIFATEGTVLVEASPRDRIWGIGLGANNPKALHKSTWRGRNWLGYALTDVRQELMEEEKKLKSS